MSQHHPMAPPPACLFVVRLLPMAAAEPGAPLPCVGQLEHVLSGRRHDFADGAALLECLAHEQRQATTVAAAGGAGVGGRAADRAGVTPARGSSPT